MVIKVNEFILLIRTAARSNCSKHNFDHLLLLHLAHTLPDLQRHSGSIRHQSTSNYQHSHTCQHRSKMCQNHQQIHQFKLHFLVFLLFLIQVSSQPFVPSVLAKWVFVLALAEISTLLLSSLLQHFSVFQPQKIQLVRIAEELVL